MKPLSECRLYGFVDTAWLQGRAPESIAQQLCEGGADLIQLRAKSSSLQEITVMAKAILPTLRAASVGLVINDYPEIAREVGAEFCHLGQEDFSTFGASFAELRRSNPKLRFGLSTHSIEQAEMAAAVGADYIAIGPVYTTGTKPDAQPVTLELVRWAATRVSLPWFAIGGITLQNLNDVVAAGARRICVVSRILNSDDITTNCRAFRQSLLG